MVKQIRLLSLVIISAVGIIAANDAYSQCTARIIIDTISTPLADSCEGQSIQFRSDSSSIHADREWSFGDGTPLISTNNPFHIFRTTGTDSCFTITLSIDCDGDGNLDDTDTLQFCVWAKPNVVFNPLNPVICNLVDTARFQNLSDTSVGNSCSWSFPGGIPNSSTDCNPPGVVYSTAGTKTISLTVSDAQGCDSTFTTTITVNSSPNPDFTVDAFTKCDSTDSCFTFTNITSLTNIVECIWDFGDGDTLNTMATPVNNCYPDSGGYTVRLTCENNAGCENFITKNVTLNHTPSANFTINPDSLCANVPTAITYTGDATPGATYSWNFGANAVPATASTLGPHSVLWLTPGAKSVTLNVTENGCSNTKTLPVEIYPIINMDSITRSIDTICQGESVTFTAFPEDLPGGYQWFTTAGDTLGFTLFNQITTTSLNQGTQNIFVVGVDTNNCGSFPSDTIPVHVKRLPLIDSLVSDKDSICRTDVVNFTAFPSGYDQYDFYINFVLSQSGASSTFSSSALDDGDIVWVQPSDSGCLGPRGDSIQIAVFDTLLPPQPNCGGSDTDTVLFVWNNIAGADQYELHVDTGTGWLIDTVNSSVLDTSITGLAQNDTVYFRIRSLSASNPCGNSALSDSTFCVTVQCTALSFDISNDTVVCPGTNINTRIFNIQNGDSASIAWEGIITNDSVFNITVNADTIIDVVLDDTTDQPQCHSFTRSVALSISPLPVVTLQSSASGSPLVDTVCVNDIVTFTASDSSFSQYHFISNINDTVQSGLSPVYLTDSLVSGEQISLAVDNNGCVNAGDSITTTVIDLPPITLEVSPDDTVCAGTLITFTARSSVAYDVYEFYEGLTLVQSSTDSVFNSATLSTGDCIWVKGIRFGGCETFGNDTICIRENGLPFVQAGANDTICIGDTATTFNATGASTYLWAPTDSLSNPAIPNPVANPTDTTTYTVTGTDGNGCTNTSSLTVVVSPLPNIVFANSTDTICANETTNLATTVTQGTLPYNYSWNPTSGLSDSTIEDPDFTPAATGTFPFNLTVTDLNGCESNNSLTVEVNPIPTVSVRTDTSICINDSIMLGNTAPGPTGATYSWNPTGSLNDNTLPNPMANPTTNTTYTVTVSDTNGCLNEDSLTITVNPLPTVNITGDSVICASGCTNLAASGAVSYSWTPGGATTPTVNVCPSADTKFFVTGIDGNQCSNIDSVDVIVRPLPIVDAGTDETICISEDQDLIATGADTYDWVDLAGNNVGSNDSITVDPDSSTTYIVTGTDNSTGCPNTDTIEVFVEQLPVITGLTGVAKMCMNNTSTGNFGLETFSVTSIENATSFVWRDDKGGSFSDSTALSTEYTAPPDFPGLDSTGTVTLYIVASNPQCGEVIDSIVVEIDRCLGRPGPNPTPCEETDDCPIEDTSGLFRDPIPEIITPNNDGFNDTWRIADLDYFENKDVKIFNRWGNIVYNNANYANDWDGRGNGGNDLPDGTYFFVLTVEEFVFKGIVMIYR